MKNPYPFTRARRIEKRRKDLGYPTRCFYCSESDIFCFQEDHPVTEDLDKDFKRVVCWNCHRKLEARRDYKHLTKNGLRTVKEPEHEKDNRYHLLLAEDLDSIAEVVQSPNASPELIASALRSAAASLRRTAPSISSTQPPNVDLVMGGQGSSEADPGPQHSQIVVADSSSRQP